MYDVIVVGGGLAGMATALRLQSKGLTTVLLEAHSRLGGCAGYYTRSGFSFDVGATTLVDFHREGIGGIFLDEIGLPPLDGEFLPGYMAWLPDRTIEVASDHSTWCKERLTHTGNSVRHQKFWRLFDQLADAFWPATRRGLKMPIRSVDDLRLNWHALTLSALPLTRYLNWSVGDALSFYGLKHESPLVGLLSMMIEDTVHSGVYSAPLVNAALGVSIRGAGLARPFGGMRGFWRSLSARYIELGGTLKLSTRVQNIAGSMGAFAVSTERQQYTSSQVVCAVPAQAATRLAPDCLGHRVTRFIERDEDSLGGALVLCLGLPAHEVVQGHRGHRHHQLMQSYEKPLGNGNNMFMSVSAEDDRLSAPGGWRSVMISTHCSLSDWQDLSDSQYSEAKRHATGNLLSLARRVYPTLGLNARVVELGTPRTYEAFTSRPRGAIGGIRLTMQNSNQNALPYDIGKRGFWLVGDTTWPGLGTVACVLGSSHVSRGALALSHKAGHRHRSS